MTARNLPVEEAQARILAGIDPLASERIPVGRALGRVLAEELVALRSVPPADNSAMDGYALAPQDGEAIQNGESRTLSISQEIPAGAQPCGRIVEGHAARIFTGAPIPPGADRVVLQEWTEKDPSGSAVLVGRSGGAGSNVRRAGEDVREGQVLASAGAVVSPGLAALWASQGFGELMVGKRPLVGIVSTGDEVHEPGQPIPEGHIYSGNSVALEALVEEAGGVPRFLGIARDNSASLREVLGRAKGCDVLITIGGVSVGDYDAVKEVVAELGGRQEFWKVRMRPGKPNAWGHFSGIPWFGLPGNPVSSMVSFLQFVRPALRALQGASELFLPTRTARLSESVQTREGFLFFLRGILTDDPEGGQPLVRTTGPQGSGILRSMSEANALVLVPESRSSMEAGELVQVQPLPWAGRWASGAGLKPRAED